MFSLPKNVSRLHIFAHVANGFFYWIKKRIIYAKQIFFPLILFSKNKLKVVWIGVSRINLAISQWIIHRFSIFWRKRDIYKRKKKPVVCDFFISKENTPVTAFTFCLWILSSENLCVISHFTIFGNKNIGILYNQAAFYMNT